MKSVDVDVENWEDMAIKTSGDRRYAEDSPDRRASSGKRLWTDTLGGKTVNRQLLRTRPPSAVCAKGTDIPALTCTNTASEHIYCKILANKLESDVYISVGCEVMECKRARGRPHKVVYIKEIRSLYIFKIKAKAYLLSNYNVYNY